MSVKDMLRPFDAAVGPALLVLVAVWAIAVTSAVERDNRRKCVTVTQEAK